MPILNGNLTNGWAIADVLVGVGEPRSRVLRKHNFVIPSPIHVRALVDTGATISCFTSRVFRELAIGHVRVLKVLTPSTVHDAPFEAKLYDVSLSLVAEGREHAFPITRVMEADCWLPDEGLEGLIGMDVLSRCFFQLMGPDRRFTLAF